MLRQIQWTRPWLLAGLGLVTGCAADRPRVTFNEQPSNPGPFVVAAPERAKVDPARDRVMEAEALSRVSYEAGAGDGPRLAPEAPDAADAESTLSLATLESWALARNPSIQQASASAFKAMGIREQVGLAPNPTVGFFGEQIGDDGTDQYGAFVAQTFVLGGKLELNRNVLSHSVQAQLWEVEAQRRRVITDVRLKFYDALAARQRLDVASEFGEVLLEGVRVAEVRKQVAEGTQSEILLARIQRSEFEVLKQRAAVAYDAAWKELAATVGVRVLPPAALADPAFIPPGQRNWDSVYQDIIARSPELKAANARLCRAAANVHRQEAQPIPNLEIQAGIGHDLATDRQFGRVQAGVPIPLSNRNQGNMAAADAEYCRAQQDYRRIELSLSARLARVAREYDSARVAFERYDGEIIPQARENLKLTEQGYSAGEFGFLEALTARRTYFEASLELIDARRNLAQAAATIEGLLLTGGLDDAADVTDDDGLRGQALDAQ